MKLVTRHLSLVTDFMASSSLWQRFQQNFLRYDDLGISIDISRMKFPDDFFEKMAPKMQKAFAAMRNLEAGGIANPDEKRMVGHYWLRKPSLAPTAELRTEIENTIAAIKKFASSVHGGTIENASGGKFQHILSIGIGGSALGPQFIAAALGATTDPLDIFFFDNTDPDGFDRVFSKIGNELGRTLVVVISKSGGTKETRNGMVEAEARFKAAGLNFSRHAIAITGAGSDLDKHAKDNGWLARFPMWDWVGGRTSVMSAVGLVPMALQGFDIDSFLAGAAAMDERTRTNDFRQNAAMLLALMWFYIGNGRGEKDMVVLPYKDRLLLVQPLPSTAGDGIVRQREGPGRKNRQPGDRSLWKQRFDGSACVCAATARRGPKLLCHLHRSRKGPQSIAF